MGLNKSDHFIALLGISTLFLFEYFSLNLLNVIEPAIADEFNCSNLELGWLGSIYFYAMMFLLIPAGYIIDKYNVNKVIVLCALAGTVGTFLLAVSASYIHLIISRAMVGICLGPFALIASIKFISKLVKRDDTGIFISAILFIGIFGGALSQDAFGLIVNGTGWRKALIIVSAISGGISVVLALTVIVYGQKHEKIIFNNKSFFNELKSFLNKKNIGISFKLGIMASVLNLPLFILGSIFGVAYLEQCYGISAIIAANITSYLFWGMLIGCIIFGMLSYRGYKENTLLFIGGLLAIVALSLLILLSISNEVILKLIFFVIGISAGSHVLSYSLINQINDYKSLGLAEGFHSALIFLGGALIQPIFGKILDATQGYMFNHNSDLIANNKLSYKFGFILLLLLLFVGLYYFRIPANKKGLALTDAAPNIS